MSAEPNGPAWQPGRWHTDERYNAGFHVWKLRLSVASMGAMDMGAMRYTSTEVKGCELWLAKLRGDVLQGIAGQSYRSLECKLVSRVCIGFEPMVVYKWREKNLGYDPMTGAHLVKDRGRWGGRFGSVLCLAKGRIIHMKVLEALRRWFCRGKCRYCKRTMLYKKRNNGQWWLYCGRKWVRNCPWWE